MPIRLVVACIFVSLGVVSVAAAYDTTSHRSLGRTAASRSTLDSVLHDSLGFPDGQATALRNGGLILRIDDWVGHGAYQEDVPLKRVLNHFHNPLRPWSAAGLSLLRSLGDSSVLWSQRAIQA